MLAAPPKTTVLVVEDDANLRDFYRTTLTIAGYTVVAVGDGLDALVRIEQFIPNAVILDMELPRLGGRDVHRELAAHPETRNIPIVVVSGTDISDLNPADFACVLKKPIKPEAIVETIDRCLGLR